MSPLPAGVRLGAFRPADAEPLARYWNTQFADRPNFFPLTADLLRRRIFEVRNAVEAFDPQGLVLARAGETGQVVGVAHFGVRPEAFCRACHGPSWPGGDQGYLAFLHVAPAWRRRGIGAALYGLARAGCRAARDFVVDGTCINPYYGNSAAPGTPLWGTPEGIALAEEDAETAGFLARRGHRLAWRAVTLALAFDPLRAVRLAGEAEVEAARLAGEGYPLLSERDRVPPLSGGVAEEVPYEPGYPFVSAYAHRAGRVVATAVGYFLAEIGPGRAAIYELKADPAHAGRGIGRAVCLRLVAELARAGATDIEVLTIPEVSPAAWALYQRLGFRPRHRWAIFQ